MGNESSDPLRQFPAAREAGRGTRRLLFGACLAPALVLCAAGLVPLLGAQSTPPSAALSLLAGLAWTALVARRAWRDALVEIGLILLERCALVPLVYLFLLVLLLSGADLERLGWAAAAAWLGGMCLAAGVRAAERGTLRRSLFVLLANALLLAGADVAVRRLVLPGKSHDNVFIEHDPNLGWKLRAGVRVLHRTERYTALETINAQGFRTPEVECDKPSGVRRVVVLGDSHTEAYTVNDGETWTALLQGMLAREGSVEVIALGAGGWSTDQELLCWLHYGRRYGADLVVLQFCSNDPPFNALDRYWRGSKPRFERHGEQLFLTGVPVPNLRNTGLFSGELLQRSALALLAESILRQLALDRDVRVEADLEEGWRVTELLIRDLARLVRADGARFAAFNANTRVEPEADRRLRAILAAHGIPYLETDAAYRDDFESYWAGGHWNRKGQAAVAELLAPQVAALLGSPAPAESP
jgi:lysophospholipase L1-like esterase